MKSVCPGGQLNICGCCLSDSPLSPCTTLYSSSSFALCLLCPLPSSYLLPLIHFPNSSVRLCISLLSRFLFPRIPTELSLRELQHHHNSIPAAGLTPAETNNHMCSSFMPPRQHRQKEPWMYVISR